MDPPFWFPNAFAGDVTYNVPSLGTEEWVQGFGKPIVQKWKHWDIDGQVAGYCIIDGVV